MVKCIGGVKFTMYATVLQGLASNGEVATGPGEFVYQQDPDSNEIVRVFVPSVEPDAGAPESQYDIPCYVRGYVDLGFRSSATREIYLKGDYSVFEAVEMDFPAAYRLTRQSYVTNIRRLKNDLSSVFWIEEETGEPTVWQVQGVTPVFDMFGRHISNKTVLLRSEIQ